MIELQSRLLGLDLIEITTLGSQMKWITAEETEGKTKFALVKMVRTAMEEAVGACEDEELENLFEKIRTILEQLESKKTQEKSEKDDKVKQELLELETQYEKLSKEQEALKEKMKSLEICAQKQSNTSKNTATGDKNKEKTGSEINPTDLNSSIFRRELKIQGQVGEPGQKDKLTYQSLISQMETGISKGYSEKEVVSAVVRSIQAGLQLRSYLEGLSGLTLPRLRKILRFHFQEKSATELYQVLANISQTPKEDPQAFLIRALTIRQKIVFASQESDSPIKYDEALVQGLFLHALETGLADETIRAKIRPLLKNTSVADEDLIEVMSLAMSAESERANKFNQGARSRPAPKVANIEVGVEAGAQEGGKSKPQESQILATLKAIQSDLNTVQSEVATLRKKVDEKNNPEVDGGTRKEGYSPRGTYPRRCKSCWENNLVECSHCFNCGGHNHTARYCRSGNGRRLPPRDRV